MSIPAAPSNSTASPIAMRPRDGSSSPATERSKVVLPLPDAPSSATTSPGFSVIDTPCRILLSPYCKCRSSTTSLLAGLFMKTDSEAQRRRETGGDQRDVDQRQRGDLVDRAGAPQRNEHRADDFGSLPEQIDAGRGFALEDHEHPQPPGPQSGAVQR